MKIDLVFSGGGIRGYALIGAIKALEEKGYSFGRVAGTSAGACLAAFVAAGYKGEEIQQMMDEVDLQKFLDTRKNFLPSMISKWFLLYWRLGLYRGLILEQWIEAHLQKKGVRVFGDLPEGVLRVVASDLTNSRMMVIPDDLNRYGYDPQEFSVAKAVRMSAGIPYFFEPAKLEQVGNKRSRQPIIVDGGVLSNFPIWLFEQVRKEHKRPLLGIQLSPKLENRPPNKIKNAIDLFKALFETMMDAHDLRYISRSVEKNIIFIPVENVLSRDFEVTKEKRQEVVNVGYAKATEFLKTWSF
ncbi:patatin-like phospholipase family protein [Bacillus salitolerans]|uniref:Patatin-like phospholipase family protein n=1 Tax=Bacillus salitolerans TaxID=1437434 RepID=A0ABW4LMN1_9BACI